MSREVARRLLHSWLTPHFKKANATITDSQIDAEIDALLEELKARGLASTVQVVNAIIRKKFPGFDARGEGT